MGFSTSLEKLPTADLRNQPAGNNQNQWERGKTMKRVLIIEPSKSFAQFLKYVLTRLDYEVIHLESATQALKEIPSIMPDLILSEANLRDLSGIELCRQLKEKSFVSGIPMAIISIDGSIETRHKAQEAGCIDYLTKPVTARTIHDLLERHLPFSSSRCHIRAKMNIAVIIDDGVKARELQTATIGEGGLYACTDDTCKEGTKLRIRLPLPSLGSALDIMGEVIYLSHDNSRGIPNGMGIKFVGLDHNTSTLLRHYMECYLSDFLPVSPQNE